MDSSSATPVGGPEQAWFRDGPAVEPAKSDRSNSDYVPLLVSHLESIPVLGNLHPYFMDQAFEGELGVGGFFDVQKKTIKHDDKPRVVAIKRLKPTFSPANPVAGYAADPRALRTMLREIQVMETMKDSPFILELLDVGSWPDSAFHSTPFLVVELATGGTLTKFLGISKANATDDLPAHAASGYHDHGYALRKSLLIDVASGLHVLHQNAIFHTDLKPDNILVFSTGNHNESYHAKISDFGSSIIRNASTPDNRILFGRDSGETDGYKAPELYAMSSSDLLNLRDPELRKLDIFSFGVVLIETISSCRITGLPFGERKVTADSVASLSFLRGYIGEEEWNETVLRALEACLSDSSSRCDNLPDILALLGQDSQESFTTAPSLEGVFTSKTLAFLDQGSKMMINSGGNIDMPSLFKIIIWLTSPPRAVTDYDLLISAAIIFGKEQSTDHLELICELLDEFGVSLNFHIESLGEENLVSPLMLASYFGNTDAVRILTGAHRERSCMSRFKSDNDVDEICSILADGVTPEDMRFDIPPLEAFAIRCWGSMQPSIWEFFLSIVDEDPEIRTKMGVAFRESITSVFFSLFQTVHMVLHGPKYTERLIWQLRQGMEFFIDVDDPNFIAHLLTPMFSIPEPHLQVAVIEACKDLATSAEAAPYDTETLKAIMFTFNSKAAAQNLSVGHSLGGRGQ
ncbi:kinase-like domain-containing protein [Lasiosphaeria miniovina]|uniref:Kinase-like domain-containing protein n=1 Tax=Lasiosphaeria miniovina TaxID=1954250 RepID=A0AA40BF72_9PEZI|nr:kinase-like domain-containing protein [Lasiosphaeria miniovina]KAK0733140.1 kinase-like domain-containing protein [Lasiosphaeria miniovina]